MIAVDGYEHMADPPPPYTAVGVPGFAALPQVQQDRLTAMVAAAELYSLSQALDRARNTVVAAVNGEGGNPEGDFLAAAWALRGNLRAFDPDMKVGPATRMLTDRHVPPGGILVSQSVTGFGHHVPQTELLIPDPGPWIFKLGDEALAACIEYVLGPQSTAYVLTDNEPGSAQAQALTDGLQAANNAGQPGYPALTWNVAVPQVAPPGGQGGPLTALGGARLEINHSPQYRLVTVRRP